MANVCILVVVHEQTDNEVEIAKCSRSTPLTDTPHTTQHHSATPPPIPLSVGTRAQKPLTKNNTPAETAANKAVEKLRILDPPDVPVTTRPVQE